MDFRELDGTTIALVFIGDVDGSPDGLHMNLARAQSDGVELILDFGLGPFDPIPRCSNDSHPCPRTSAVVSKMPSGSSHSRLRRCRLGQTSQC